MGRGNGGRESVAWNAVGRSKGIGLILASTRRWVTSAFSSALRSCCHSIRRGRFVGRERSLSRSISSGGCIFSHSGGILPSRSISLRYEL